MCAHVQVVARLAAAEKREKKSLARQMEEDIRAEDSSLTLQDVNTLLHVLWEKKESMEKQEAEASLMLLLQFLHHARYDLPANVFMHSWHAETSAASHRSASQAGFSVPGCIQGRPVGD
jgi:hypothetical protein